MSDLKLAKLPDRTPVKLTIAVLPDLHARPEAYGRPLDSTEAPTCAVHIPVITRRSAASAIALYPASFG